MRRILMLPALLLSVYALAQSPGNDFRKMQYYPEGDAFVCTNGNNRFTRALYGGNTLFRIETSDRPVFAAYNKTDNKNIRFRLTYKGNSVFLDSTSYCMAGYVGARRDYTLSDKNWDNGKLHISVLAYNDHEGGIWQFNTEGFNGKVKIEGLICEIANSKLNRMGDLGVEKPGSFEAPLNPKKLKKITWDATNNTSFVSLDNQDIKILKGGNTVFQKTDAERKSLVDRIKFCTPDPYINTIGGALSAAADGVWDGQTWLHGAIGWRMPLPGWRAGFLGDVLGMNDRAVCHFNAYAASQVTDVAPTIPHPSQDSTNALSRCVYKWGTQMYSNGYICRNPYNSHQFHHYDMNLNYIDELLWHFCFDADTAYMRKMWPTIKLNLEWEKRNWDPDNDGLYDAYCCIWASDALYYNSGAATHSSAYNYRANLLAARIAQIIGEDATPYKKEAEKILDAMNRRLWLKDKGHWAEYQDFMGLKRIHRSAALWSIYTPIDCGACSPLQAYQATEYIDREIPHIPVKIAGDTLLSKAEKNLFTVSTTNWMPYDWSINNVAQGEVMHTALSYFEAGRNEEGYRLMKGMIMDGMYLGQSPGNFGQISYYDASLGECYRDFGDVVGISSRTLIEGLFGVKPDALFGRCILQPGFPSEWRSASLSSPYMDYSFSRNDKTDTYIIKQNFKQQLSIVIRAKLPFQDVNNVTVNGIATPWKIVRLSDKDAYAEINAPADKNLNVVIKWSGDSICSTTSNSYLAKSQQTDKGTEEPLYDKSKQFSMCKDLKYNANITDIFKNKYTSPSSPYTTLRIPENGVGQWCHPIFNPEINDSVFRSLAKNDTFYADGIPFHTPANSKNIIYTSLWDNYPDSVTIPIKGKASSAFLLMAGSTNPMQSRIANGIITVHYKDGSSQVMELVNPDNWCPIEQDYYVDNKAFYTSYPRPLRVGFKTGIVSRNISDALNIKGAYREIPGGAGTILKMKLDPSKKLKSITLRTLSNDVVIGLISITLQQ